MTEWVSTYRLAAACTFAYDDLPAREDLLQPLQQLAGGIVESVVVNRHFERGQAEPPFSVDVNLFYRGSRPTGADVAAAWDALEESGAVQIQVCIEKESHPVWFA